MVEYRGDLGAKCLTDVEIELDPRSEMFKTSELRPKSNIGPRRVAGGLGAGMSGETALPSRVYWFWREDLSLNRLDLGARGRNCGVTRWKWDGCKVVFGGAHECPGDQ
jgi:hypothetical protein